MNPDFYEFFKLLNAKLVEYLIIGGTAYNYYAPPRATKDIDIWVNPARQNLERLRDTISEFGFPVDTLNLEELELEDRVLMLGRVPYRIDILTRPKGVRWDDAWLRRNTSLSYGDVPVPVIAAKDLIAAKKAAARPRDLADIATLEEIEKLYNH